MLGSAVALRRRSLGISQEKLAEQVGLSRGAIAQIERGEIEWPRPETLQALAKALQTTIPQLLREAGIIPAADEELEKEMAALITEVPEFAEWFDIAREISKYDKSKLGELVRHARWLLEQEKIESSEPR